MMLVYKVLDCVQMSISTGQREWGVTRRFVDCTCTYMSVLNDCSHNYRMLTSRITMMLVNKVLDCVQVAIGTGQRE